MTINTSLKADYVELANGVLDQIPILKEEDIKIVRSSLKCLINKKEIAENLPASIKDKVSSLKEIIDSPELYATDEFKLEFISIIIERIKEKIKELKNLNENEKRACVERFKDIQEKTAKNLELMSKARPPIKGSEAHTISIAPEIVEQIKEILESFFWKLQVIENTLLERGMDIHFKANFFQKNSYIDIKEEEEVKCILEMNFDIPSLPITDDPNEIVNVLSKYFIKYFESLEVFDLTGEVRIDASDPIQKLLDEISIKIEIHANMIAETLKNKGFDFMYDFKFKEKEEEINLSQLKEILNKSLTIPKFDQVDEIEKIKLICAKFFDDIKECFDCPGLKIKTIFVIEMTGNNPFLDMELNIDKIISDFQLKINQVEKKLNSMGFWIVIENDVSLISKLSLDAIEKAKETNLEIPEFPKCLELDAVQDLLSEYIKKYKDFFSNIGFLADIKIFSFKNNEENHQEVMQIVNEFYEKMECLEKKIQSIDVPLSVVGKIFPNPDKPMIGNLEKFKELRFEIQEFSQNDEWQIIVRNYLDTYIQALENAGFRPIVNLMSTNDPKYQVL